ncbi:MAG: hypothetical protein J0H82_09425 [Alphaproteobacteria bacterium]|jgi:hypothetical protein|nr:hypothetical protein [Alphaproteobacteria bacterium]
MSDLDSLLDRLRESYAAINEVERVAANAPGDKFVLANLTALKREASRLESIWEEECRSDQVEVCRYRLIPAHDENYDLASVAKSLLDFQELFSQIFDSLKNGVKKRPRISGIISAETAFNFGFSYPGSLGIALMVASEKNLFSGKFDEAVKAFNQVLRIEDEFAVRDVAKNLGDAVVKKVYDWSKVNYFSGYNIDIIWSSVDGVRRGGAIDMEALGRIVDLIEKTSDVAEDSFESRGTLVGIDSVKKRFRFVDPDGLDYSGGLADDFPLEKKWAINSPYVADIMVQSVTEYATQETKQTHKLRNLRPISGD